MIKIYSLSTCPWCKKLKKFFDDRNIAYEAVEVDIAEPELQKKALAEVEKLAGEQVFPVSVVKGQTIIGFKPEEMLELLGDES